MLAHPGIGSIAGTFTRGGGISVDAKGNIFAVDKVMCSIQVFGANLEFLYILGDEKGEQMPYLSSPLGLAVVGNKIFVADRVLGVVVLEMSDESQIVKKEVKH